MSLQNILNSPRHRYAHSKPKVHEQEGFSDRASYKAAMAKARRSSFGVEGKYDQYYWSARYFKRDWVLSFEEFQSFWQKPCYYCGGSISTIGLDRVDNSKGYQLDNIVPCCRICNKAKSNMEFEVFIEYLERVAKFVSSGGLKNGICLS